MPEERLQKILSQAGVTSRRKAEDMILHGRVTVNGETITELGSKANLEVDHIKVDGTLLHAPHKLVYIALNKPREVVTTVSDPEGRQTVMHLLRGIKERVFPVGRLDYSSEGLLLLTNDGEFAHRITAPASHMVKTYVVKVNGALTDEQVAAFASGIPLHGRRTAPAHIKLIKPGENPWYEVRLSEGRQNQIRMMFKHFGKLVEKLRRVKIGFLELDLAPGRFRPLTTREVEKFRHILKLDQPDAKPAAAPPTEATSTARPARSAKPALSVRRPRRFAPPKASETESEVAPPPSRPSGPSPSFAAGRPAGRSGPPRPDRSSRPSRPAGADRPSGPSRAGSGRPPASDRPSGFKRPPSTGRPSGPNRSSGPSRSDSGRPPASDRPSGFKRPPSTGRPSGPNRPSGPSRSDSGRPPASDRPSGFKRPPSTGRPSGPNRPSGPSRSGAGRPPTSDRPSGFKRPSGPNRSSGPSRPPSSDGPSGSKRPTGPSRGAGPRRPSGPPRGGKPPSRGKPRV